VLDERDATHRRVVGVEPDDGAKIVRDRPNHGRFD
jgi:hypothetical protein